MSFKQTSQLKQKVDIESSDDQLQESQQNQKHSSSQLTHNNTPEVQVSESDMLKYQHFFEPVLKEQSKCSHQSIPENQSHKPSQSVNETFRSHMTRLQKKLLQKLQQKQFIVAKNKQKNLSDSDNKKVNFKFKMLRSLSSYELVELFCQLGRFSKRFIVLNSFMQSPLHECCQQVTNQGSLSTVYNFKFNKQNYVVKCIQFKGNNKSHFSTILKQIFVAWMMSVLGIGPKLRFINGFDFCVYKDCVEFAMQVCTPFQYSIENEMSLKESLLKMHCLKLVHIDIKPQNIQFSSYFNKPVFIDFGLSQILQQRIGKRTMTSYMGTCEYSGLQMIRLMKSLINGLVDLYGNDVFGLEKYLNEQRNQNLLKPCNDIIVDNNSDWPVKQKQQDQISQIFNKQQWRLHKKYMGEPQGEQRLLNYNCLMYQISQIIELWTRPNEINQNLQTYNHQLSQFIFTSSIKCQLYYREVFWKKNLNQKSNFNKVIQLLIEKYQHFSSLREQLYQFSQDLKKSSFLIQTSAENVNDLTVKEPGQINKLEKQKQTKLILLFYEKQIKKCQKMNSLNLPKQRQIKQKDEVSKNQNKDNENENENWLILADQQKVKQLLIKENKFDQYLELLITSLTFTEAKGIKIEDKLEFMRVMNQIKSNQSVKETLKKLNLGFQYIFGDYSQKRFCKNDNVCRLPFQHEYNQHLKSIFQFYQKLISLIIEYPSLKLNQSAKSKDQDFEQIPRMSLESGDFYDKIQNQTIASSNIRKWVESTLMIHAFDIIKNAIILGFDYLPWLRKALLSIVKYIVSQKHLSKHFFVIILKQFVEIGILVNTFYTLREKRINNEEDSHYFFIDFINQNFLSFENLEFLNEISFTNHKQKDNMKRVLSQVLPHCWIFFNYQDKIFLANSQDLRVKIFTMLLYELKNQFYLHQQEQQFKLVQLYQIQLQKIRQISLRKHLLVTFQLQRSNVYLNINLQEIKLSLIWGKKQNKKKEVKKCLNYFTLTRCLKFGRKEVTVEKQACLQKSLAIVEQIIGVHQLSLFFNIELRLIKIVQSKQFKNFQCFMYLFGHQKVDNKCSLQILQMIANFMASSSNFQPVTENYNFFKKVFFITWEQFMKILENMNHQSKSQQSYIFKDYFKQKHIIITCLASNLLKNGLSLQQDCQNSMKIKQKVESYFFIFQNLIKKFESNHKDCLSTKLAYRFNFHQIKLEINELIKFYTKKNQLKTLINLTTLFLEKLNLQVNTLSLQKNSQKNQQDYYVKKITNLLNKFIFFNIIPSIIPVDLIDKFWDLYGTIDMNKEYMTFQVQIWFLCSIKMLMQSLINKDQRFEQYFGYFKCFLNRNFNGSQNSSKQAFDQQWQFTSKMHLMKSIISQTSDLMNSLRKFFNEAITQTDQVFSSLFLEILKINNLMMVEVALVLLNDQLDYFLTRLPLKIKILVSIAKIFQKAQQKGYSIKKYYGQYFFHVSDLKMQNCLQKINIQSFLNLKKLLQYNFIKQSNFTQNLAQFIIDFLNYKPQLSQKQNQRKYSKNALEKLKQKHLHKNIKFLQVCLQDLTPKSRDSQQNWFERQNLIRNQILSLINKINQAYFIPIQYRQIYWPLDTQYHQPIYDQNEGSFDSSDQQQSQQDKNDQQCIELKKTLYGLSRILIEKQLKVECYLQDKSQQQNLENYLENFVNFVTTNYQL